MATGIWASGKNVTVQDNTITRVRHTDDDVDAIRFFGDGFRVLHGRRGARQPERTGYGREVGFDHPSAREGYQGPPAR